MEWNPQMGLSGVLQRAQANTGYENYGREFFDPQTGLNVMRGAGGTGQDWANQWATSGDNTGGGSMTSGMTGLGGNDIWRTYDGAAGREAKDNFALNGSQYQMYDDKGQFTGEGTWQGLDKNTPMKWAIPLAMMAAPFALTAMGVGGAAGAGGAGAAGSGAGFVGEGALSGIGAWDGALAGATAGSVGAGAGGAGLLSQLGKLGGGSLGKLAGGLGGLFGGAGGGSGGSGGFGLNDLLGLIGGGVDANRQGDAAQKMLQWLNTNQGKMEGYMNPESAEYKAMWEQMSRKDAAAGRNSQYGPRTSDFLANVAKAKADNTRMFTTGTSRAYADALNQDAGKYAGLSAALQRAATGGAGGSPINLSSIVNGLFGGGSSDFGSWAQDLGLGAGDWGPNPADIDFGGIDIANMSDDDMLDWFTNGDW